MRPDSHASNESQPQGARADWETPVLEDLGSTDVVAAGIGPGPEIIIYVS